MWDKCLNFSSCLPFLAGKENHQHRKTRVPFSSHSADVLGLVQLHPSSSSSNALFHLGTRSRMERAGREQPSRDSSWERLLWEIEQMKAQFCALFPLVAQGQHIGAFDLLKGSALPFSWVENGDRRQGFTGLEGSLVGGQTPVKCTPWHHCPQGLYRRFLLWFETAGLPVRESKWGKGSVSAKTVFYKTRKR